MARRKPQPPAPPETTVASVKALLESLRRESALDAHDEALGQVALRIARTLDGESSSTLVVALSRELRSTMAELTKGRASDGSGDDDDFAASLPPAVWDPPQP